MFGPRRRARSSRASAVALKCATRRRRSSTRRSASTRRRPKSSSRCATATGTTEHGCYTAWIAMGDGARSRRSQCLGAVVRSPRLLGRSRPTGRSRRRGRSRSRSGCERPAMPQASIRPLPGNGPKTACIPVDREVPADLPPPGALALRARKGGSSPATCSQRFLTSSIHHAASSSAMRTSEPAAASRIIDIDFRNQRRREFAGTFLSPIRARASRTTRSCGAAG